MIQEWIDDAACRGEDTNLFFPERGGEVHSKTKKAVAICNECAVRQDCLDYAMRLGLKNGIYGGLSGNQRRSLKSVGARSAA
jgi:WhiB family redox-sensing transcriptional regulator